MQSGAGKTGTVAVLCAATTKQDMASMDLEIVRSQAYDFVRVHIYVYLTHQTPYFLIMFKETNPIVLPVEL